jgi:hypothetical protein
VNIKELFDNAENGTLTWDQFEASAKAGGAKFTDLSEGKYVSKSKYDDDVKSKDDSIAKLNETITARDTDLKNLKEQLASAGTDADKLSQLQSEFDALQGKYNADMEAYQQQLATQQYEFAVKEFANGKEFTSQAAKRDFIRSLISENLKMKGDSIIGADDFAKSYAEENADAFVTKSESNEANTSTNGSEANKPQFVSTTPGATTKTKTLTELMMAANENPRGTNFL